MKYNLHDDLAERCRDWKVRLVSLENYSIPRVYRPRIFREVADAPEGHGYGTVSYIRLMNKQGRIHNSFKMGKSRVNPTGEMNKIVNKELVERNSIDNTTFYPDSTIVLRNILSETKRFVTFVANRVAVIRE